MLFWAGKLFQTVFWPLGLGLFLLLLSRIFFSPRYRQRLFIAGFMVILIPSLPLISNLVRDSVESSFPTSKYESVPERAAMVILGGTMSSTLIPGNLPEEPWGSRVVPAIFLARKFPSMLVVVSSGYTYRDARGNSRTEADDMAELMIAHGIAPDRVLREKRSRNTYENARYSSELLAERGIDQILLVTSALHMRRSSFLFERQHLNPLAVPTAREVPQLGFGWQDLLPDAYALAGTTRALREIVGYAAYRLFYGVGLLR